MFTSQLEHLTTDPGAIAAVVTIAGAWLIAIVFITVAVVKSR